MGRARRCADLEKERIQLNLARNLGAVILSFASKSDDASSSITEPALQALGAANLQT